MLTNRKLITVFVLALMAFMVSGSAATMSYAATQTLPSYTDPTGQNLPCMMIISTLPPPPKALQCQEPSGQILPCSYTTQNLSNGEQIVAITVYVPANYLFSGYGSWTVVKLIVHETKTRIVHEPCPKGQTLDPKTNKCVDIKYCPPPIGYHIDSITHKCIKDPQCQPGQVYNPVTGKCEPQILKCERADSSAITDPDKNLKTKDCDIHDANEHGMIPTPPPPPCKDNTTCPYINTTKPLASATIQPSNTSSSIPASGKSGAGSTCVAGNCTSGTTPATVDCTKNPTDPSCTQTLTPPPAAITKRCPDGSVIDASANCPTQSTPPTNPNTPSTPPSTSGTPQSNNPSPPSSGNNGGGGSSSGSGGSGSGGSSDGGFTPTQPSSVS